MPLFRNVPHHHLSSVGLHVARGVLPTDLADCTDYRLNSPIKGACAFVRTHYPVHGFGAEAMASTRSDLLIFYSSAACSRRVHHICRVVTRVRGEQGGTTGALD